MALFAISDLHLPLGVDKPMEVFGERWENYVFRLKENWQKVVGKEDTVVLAGDFSWATYIEQSYEDFKFLDELNGTKILSKGNHDYWWTTTNKLNQFIFKNDFKDIGFLSNNCFVHNNIAICGTKGVPGVLTEFSDEQDKKIYNRELVRLELSLQAAKKLSNVEEIVAFLHYMPHRNPAFVDVLQKYGVKRCYYGHLHGETSSYHEGNYAGEIKCQLLSCDYLGFVPIKISN